VCKILDLNQLTVFKENYALQENYLESEIKKLTEFENQLNKQKKLIQRIHLEEKTYQKQIEKLKKVTQKSEEKKADHFSDDQAVIKLLKGNSYA
jgi:transcriptional regulator of heat shock response